jgi:hypothetical protein
MAFTFITSDDDSISLFYFLEFLTTIVIIIILYDKGFLSMHMGKNINIMIHAISIFLFYILYSNCCMDIYGKGKLLVLMFEYE